MFILYIVTTAVLWVVGPVTGFAAQKGAEPSRQEVLQTDAPRIVLNAMEGFSVPDGATEAITRVLAEHLVQLVRRRYELSKTDVTARDRLKQWDRVAVRNGMEQCPVLLIPGSDAVLAAASEVKDSKVISGLWFDTAQGQGGQYVARGRIPSSAMGTVAAPRPSLTIGALPFIVPAPPHPEEIADRAYRIVTTIQINDVVCVVESGGKHSAMIAIADGRPFASEYKREFPESSEIVQDLRVFHIPWVGVACRDPSLVDPEFPANSALFGPVIGGQVRVGIPLALFDKFGGVICLVAAQDWKPFDPRYELRSIDSLTRFDDIRAIYVRVDELPIEDDGFDPETGARPEQSQP